MLLTRRRFAAASALIATTGPVAAQIRADPSPPIPTLRIAQAIDLTGPASTAGDNWRNGVEMATQAINARGGILGQMIQPVTFDSQSGAGAHGVIQRALEGEPYALLGPIDEVEALASMALARDAHVTQIVGGDAASLTAQGNPYLFRCSPGQAVGLGRLAAWVGAGMGARRIATFWVNTEFGRAGRDLFERESRARGLEVVGDIMVQPHQSEFSVELAALARAEADAALIYLTEDESARLLTQMSQRAVSIPLFGTDTLIAQRVLDLAGPAANGVRAHVSETADIPELADFRRRYVARYKQPPDRFAIKGHVAVAMVKAATEQMGRVDPRALSDTLHGQTITTQMEPAILFDSSWDNTGNIDHATFIMQVEAGHLALVQTLPPLAH
jgi:branched-chain amino acid transport system substrate-binding protein